MAIVVPATLQRTEDAKEEVQVVEFNRRNDYGLTAFDVWALGISIVIGGQYFSWNFGLVAGAGSALVSFLLMGSGYTCLCLCVSEMSSALPFSGGSYGMARCILGNYMGFLLGCAETIEYIFYVAASTITLGVMITDLAPSMLGYEPVIWVLFYAVSMVIYIFGGRAFWTFNRVIAVVSVFVVFFYLACSWGYVDFRAYAPAEDVADPWFVGGAYAFVSAFPLSAWFFVGVETLKEICGDVPLPRTQIPHGQMACMATLLLTGCLVFFTSVSLPPGIAATSETVVLFNAGFQADSWAIPMLWILGRHPR
jgi:amino acid transporter